MRALACLLVLLFSTPAWSGERPTILELRSFFYGDNTEFLSNPYRDGETLLGAHLRLSAALPVGAKTRLRLGVQTDSRAGDRDPLYKFYPVIALEVGGPTDTFIMGTLRSSAFGREPWQGLWPDDAGPHGLLPPLQLDTLAITQSYDAGLQWLHTGETLSSDAWIAWRRLNTATEREKFDFGLNSRAVVYRDSIGLVALAAQGHIVHEGGQLTHVGSVGDSMVGGPGIIGEVHFGSGTLRTETFLLFAKHNPNREDHDGSDHLTGHGVFLRTSYQTGAWRGAALFWEGRDFLKWHGDPNYGALLNDDKLPFPALNRSTRMYKEFSLSYRFTLSESAYLVTNGRLYRVDGSWDYAYRVAASIRIRHLIGGKRGGR